jgi:hypothetical protein
MGFLGVIVRFLKWLTPVGREGNRPTKQHQDKA